MAIGVVDDLELIQIDQSQRMPSAGRGAVMQKMVEFSLELAAIGKTRQLIMGGLVGQLCGKTATFRDVFQNRHEQSPPFISSSSGAIESLPQACEPSGRR